MKEKKIQDLREKGITLIALVVTIIILLILAGVTLNMALSGDGLFSKARKATTDYNQKSVEEKLQILYAEKIMEDVDKSSNVKIDVTDVLEEMAGGEITQKDIEEFNKLLEPYKEEVKGIISADELAKIGQDEGYPIDGVYVQLNDIERLEEKIGSEEKPFEGIYNGNGKSIKELSITTESDCEGMFAKNEGTIKNITINSCQINSNGGRIGGIVGFNKGLIENCTVSSGSVVSNGKANDNGTKDGSRVGGICGENREGGIIRNCTNYANVKGMYKLVGGICGYNRTSSIEKCRNMGKINGKHQVGGIVGDADSEPGTGKSMINECINEGSILENGEEFLESSSGQIGGICGYAWMETLIIDCENKGIINMNVDYVGGIAGILNRIYGELYK